MDTEERVYVLVADDNAVDRKVLSSIVKSAGYVVTEAVDGLDALEKFNERRPDLVLLDALMPGKDGFEVAQFIKANSGDDFIPIIFLTSLTEAEELARCVESGGDDFLSKPYNKVILQAKLSAFDRMRDMHRTVQSQRDEITLHHLQLVQDQEAAKAVFDNVAHARQTGGSYIKQMISPLALFNGDVLLAGYTPADHLCLMLGDFTGHGLAAAIGAMPLADVFYSMIGKGFSLSEMLRECNRKLGTVLPTGNFCCATALMIDFSRYTVEYWNGGLPSAYLRRHGTNELVPLSSTNLPLGILPVDQFKSETAVVECFPKDRVLLATDGIVEARNEALEYFGVERLEEIVRNTEPSEIFETVQEQVYSFMGERDDDITMVELEIVEPERLEIVRKKEETSADFGPRDWKLSYELGPASLREFNPLPLLQQVLMEAPYLRVKATEIYTVLSELYSNGLEHGVLGLDSRLKRSADGFAQYYEARAKALEEINGFVRFDINGRYEQGRVELCIKVQDSGAGFDFEKMEAQVKRSKAGSDQYHGRGIRLLWDLCNDVKFAGTGNQVEVKLGWRQIHE